MRVYSFVLMALITANSWAIQPNPDCLRYSYKIERQWHKPEIAFQRAIRTCDKGSVKDCLEYSYETYLSLPKYKRRAQASWGKVINGCRLGRFPVWPDCLKWSHQYWKKYKREPLALESAMQTCRGGASGKCLDYAYNRYLSHGQPDKTAFTKALEICRGGTRDDCLKYAMEEWPLSRLPRDHWGQAVNICRRRR